MDCAVFAEVDIVGVGLMGVVFMGRRCFGSFAGLFELEFGVVIEYFLVFLRVDFCFLGQLVGVAQETVDIFLSELDLSGTFVIQKISRVETSNNRFLSVGKTLLYRRVVQHVHLQGAPHIFLALAK